MNNNERADIHNGIAWAIIFALAAIIMGVITLATVYPRTDLSFDYMGVVVGILSLLVTVLLGWQIWKSVALEKAIKRTYDLEWIAKGYLEFAIGMSFIEKHPENTLMQCIFALERLNQASQAEYDNIFMALESLAEIEKKLPLTNRDKNRLIRAIKGSKQSEAEELADKFKNWPTKS